MTFIFAHISKIKMLAILLETTYLTQVLNLNASIVLTQQNDSISQHIHPSNITFKLLHNSTYLNNEDGKFKTILNLYINLNRVSLIYKVEKIWKIIFKIKKLLHEI